MKRDSAWLKPCVGKARVDADVPKELKQPYIIPQTQVLRPLEYASLSDRLMTFDYNALQQPGFQTSTLFGVWSDTVLRLFAAVMENCIV